MSYFIGAEDITVNIALEFGEVTVDALNVFTCKSGEIAAWKIIQLGDGPDGEPLYISQIYDNSSGSPVLKGSGWALPKMDMTKGLFSSGCFPDGDPLASGTTFYKVDYV
jgi:hypothetical protein